MSRFRDLVNDFFDGLKQGAVDNAVRRAKKNKQPNPIVDELEALRKEREELDAIIKKYSTPPVKSAKKSSLKNFAFKSPRKEIARTETTIKGIHFIYAAWEKGKTTGESIVFLADDVIELNDKDLTNFAKSYMDESLKPARKIKQGDYILLDFNIG